jgi:heme A synthase
MKKVTIVKTGFTISLLLVLFSSWLKLIHAPGADTWLSIAAALVIIFVGIGIYEVLSSKRIDNSEKIMWTVGFILFSGLTGLAYFFMGRKRVIAAP